MGSGADQSQVTGVLPLAPFPPLHWWWLAQQGALVDVNESFVKQTERTRMRLANARGAILLPWDIVHGASTMADAHFSDHTPFATRWKRICTDYGAAPYFEHIAPELEDLFLHPPSRLVEFAEASWSWVAEWTGWKVPKLATEPVAWDAFKANPSWDLRERKALRGIGWTFHPYAQVFSPENGFVERCSVLDALMHLGPELGGKLLDLVTPEFRR